MSLWCAVAVSFCAGVELSRAPPCNYLTTVARFMTWNGPHAALLFVNAWEYTRDVDFVRETAYPLIAGIMDWYAW